MSDSLDDQRFRKVHNDPRFVRNSKRRNKVQIDQRFAAVLKDERFQSVQGKYDKYGRRIENKDSEMKNIFRLDEEDDEAKSKVQPTSSPDDENENASTPVAKSNDKHLRLDFLNRMARGELESVSESSDSEDSDNEDLQISSKDDEEEIPMGEETKRFAILHCDWTRIRAVDLFALCQSFAPATGVVQNVKIYPSDYGLEKMKEEEQHGPRGLLDDKNKEFSDLADKKKPEEVKNDQTDSTGEINADLSTSDSEDDGSDLKDTEDFDSDDPLGVKKSVTLEGTSEGFDSEKLRTYELQKLRYYYAIVTCDSVKTASTIFDQCDQLEYETSSNVLDLRYVPDDTTFTNTPKETCDSVPDHYKPAIFATFALQQTDVKLTWEEDDDQRLDLLTRPTDWKDAHDDDFKAYLASDVSDDSEVDGSDSSDEIEDAHCLAGTAALDHTTNARKETKLKKLRNRYQSMLLGSDDDDNSPEGGLGASSEEDDRAQATGNMELSFTPSAVEVLKTKRQKELEATMTPFERYVREKRQEKNRKLHEKRARQKQLEREQREVLQNKGRGAKEANLLREAINRGRDSSGAEGSENDQNERNFDLKTIVKHEKLKSLKGKRRAKEMRKVAKNISSDGLQQDFQFDATDPRFSGLYAKTSHFQLDPTDPKFKKTEATTAIFKERRQRYDQDATSASENKAGHLDSVATNSKQALNAMVENLKRKSQQHDKKKTKKSKT